MCKVCKTFCKVMLTFVALTTIVVRPASAQITPADSAAVLLGAAENFDLRGQDDIALALYRHIARSYPGTPAAQAALERLGEAGAGAAGIGSRRPEPPGDTELKVFSTLYGLWLGVLVPDALDLQGDAPNGAGLLVGGPAGVFRRPGLRTLAPGLAGTGARDHLGRHLGHLAGAGVGFGPQRVPIRPGRCRIDDCRGNPRSRRRRGCLGTRNQFGDGHVGRFGHCVGRMVRSGLVGPVRPQLSPYAGDHGGRGECWIGNRRGRRKPVVDFQQARPPGHPVGDDRGVRGGWLGPYHTAGIRQIPDCGAAGRKHPGARVRGRNDQGRSCRPARARERPSRGPLADRRASQPDGGKLVAVRAVTVTVPGTAAPGRR